MPILTTSALGAKCLEDYYGEDSILSWFGGIKRQTA